ncbi:MAG: hypothetical protein ACYC8T_38135 [Myxococcaceae bacterium]
MRIAIAVFLPTAAIVALVGCAGPNVGDPCTGTGPIACSAEDTALWCDSGKARAIPCRDADGCRAISGGVVADISCNLDKLQVGDACPVSVATPSGSQFGSAWSGTPAAEGSGFLCDPADPEKMRVLRCLDGTVTNFTSCPGGCVQDVFDPQRPTKCAAAVCANVTGRYTGTLTIKEIDPASACTGGGDTVGKTYPDDRTFDSSGKQASSTFDISSIFTCTTNQQGSCSVAVDCSFTAADGTGKRHYELTVSTSGETLTGTMTDTGTGAYCPRVVYDVNDQH